jgi:hypothetical protein
MQYRCGVAMVVTCVSLQGHRVSALENSGNSLADKIKL